MNKCRRLSGVCWIRAIERPPELVAKARLGVAEGRARRALPRLPHNAERRSTAGRRRREQKRREYSFPSRSLQHSADHRLGGYDRRKAADRQPDLRPDRHAPQPHTGAEHLRLNASVSGALRGTEGSNPSPSTGESGANLTSSIMLGYARSDSGPCRLGPTHAVIALVSAPGSTLADSHVAGPRGRSEEWYYKRGFWPRPFHYTEENRQRMLDPIEADD